MFGYRTIPAGRADAKQRCQLDFVFDVPDDAGEQHGDRLIGCFNGVEPDAWNTTQMVDLFGKLLGMLEILGGVQFQFPRDIGVGSTLEDLAIDDGSDDRLEFAG